MAYDFYLDRCMLPISPSKVSTKIGGNNKTVNLIDDGEINILKNPKLTDIELECLIPQVQYPFATYKGGFMGASYFLDYFEQLKTSKKPFQFIVSRRMPRGGALVNTNIKVSLESYDISESADDGFDFTVKLKLKQYRDYGTKTAKVVGQKKAVQKQPERAKEEPKQENQNYDVKKGDCLWNIAKKVYGDGSLWKKIYEANTNVCGKPYQKGGTTYVMIHPGDKLVIPPKG